MPVKVLAYHSSSVSRPLMPMMPGVPLLPGGPVRARANSYCAPFRS